MIDHQSDLVLTWVHLAPPANKALAPTVVRATEASPSEP